MAALAHDYHLVLAGETTPFCKLKLDRALHQAAGGKSIHLASADADCDKTFPAVKTLARWEATGGASIELLDASGQIIGDFSPVQDATGVYLRGGAGGKLYELRTAGD